MKTQTINELRFRKETIIELNEVQLLDVNGGTTPVCAAAVAGAELSSAPCGAAIGSLATAVVDVIFDWF